LPDTGMPILNRALNIVTFAVWEPEPLTVAMVMEKSLITFSDIMTPEYFDAKLDKKRPIHSKTNQRVGQGEKSDNIYNYNKDDVYDNEFSIQN
jgi:hypothetical protein